MKPSTDLFDLIKSLTASEKRYFKVYASARNTKSQYIRLFEAVDKQSEFDEEKLRNKFKGERLLKQFSVPKNYLYQLILQCMRSYHARTYADGQIDQTMTDGMILFHKGLFGRSAHQFEKALQLSHQFGILKNIPQIFEWQEKLASKMAKSPAELRHKKSILFKNEKANLNHLLIRNQVRKIYDTIYSYYNVEGRTLSDEQQQVLKKDALEPLLALKTKELPDFLRMPVFHTLALYFRLKNEPVENYRYSKEVLQLIDSKRTLVENDAIRYAAGCQNFLSALLEVGKFDEFRKLMEMYKAIPKVWKNDDSINTQVFITIMSTLLDVKFYIDTGQFTEGTQLIAEWKEKLAAIASQVGKSRMMGFSFGCTFLLIGAGAFDRALEEINYFTNTFDFNVQLLHQRCLRLMELITLYELGEFDLLAYKARSAYRHLKKLGISQKAEQRILALFMKDLPAVKNKDEERLVFRVFTSEFEQICYDVTEDNLNSYFHFLNWGLSHSSTKSFEQLCLARARKITEQYAYLS